MVRAPCCDKMGMKKGPWTPEEDQILISYVQKYGHANWRALPKQAGLLRCGKSCRLRWINYLRPDIKRGNFTADEEEAIIKLHEMLGNRWSAIAARLPGRTDNEIKNVWHTHLKKRLKQYQLAKPGTKRNSTNSNKSKSKSHSSSSSSSSSSVDTITITSTQSDDQLSASTPTTDDHETQSQSQSQQSQPSSSEVSNSTSTVTDMDDDVMMIKAENMENWESFPEIDESFWSDALSSDHSTATAATAAAPFSFQDVEYCFQSQQQLLIGSTTSTTNSSIHHHHHDISLDDDAMEFWYDLFIQAGGEQELIAEF